MSYGEYSGPDKPNKGKEGGACNRQLCQAEPALYFNHGMYKWYCGDCAIAIGEDPVNKQDWELRWKPKLGHDQFETREQRQERVEREYLEEGETLQRRLDDLVFDDDHMPIPEVRWSDPSARVKTHSVSIFGNRRNKQRK